MYKWKPPAEIRRLASKKTNACKWVKVVGIGDKGVGKTSIVKSFCESEFSSAYHETVGVDYGFKLHSLDDHNAVNVSFWDFGGDLSFESIRKYLYEPTDICLCVYDVTDHDTFTNLDSWFQEFSSACGKMGKIVVVGNKCDKLHKKQERKAADVWCSKRGFSHYVVSALTGQGVLEMFNAALSDFIYH